MREREIREVSTPTQWGTSDLGVAAYMVMKGHKLAGRQNKTIFFEVRGDNIRKLKAMKLEYLSSEFHRFDHCLMSLKKVDEDFDEDFSGYKFVTDLGAAAFILMHKFRIVGRKGKAFYFEVTSEEESKLFDRLSAEYVTSDFHKFDSSLMSVKKLGEFMM